MKPSIKPKSHASRSRNRRFALLVTTVALSGLALLWTTRDKEDPSARGTDIPHSLATTKSSRSNTGAPRMKESASDGSNAIPVSQPDPAGPSVPALVPERELIGSGWLADPDPALAGFATWTQSYLAADSAGRSAMEQRGEEIATTRLSSLEGMIAKDPRRALSAAIPLAIRDQLPASIQEKMEVRVDDFGDISLLHQTPLPGATASASRDYASVDGGFYEAYRYGTRGNLPYIKGASLHGIAVGGRLAVLDSPVRTLEQGELIEGKILNTSCPVSKRDVTSTASGTVKADEKTLFQLGDSLYGTCEPAHIGNIQSIIENHEARMDDVQKSLIAMGLTTLCEPKSHIVNDGAMAFGDSAISGTVGQIGKPPASRTLGGKSVLILCIKASDGAFPAGVDNTTFQNMTFGTDQWNDRLKRTSYNKAWISNVDTTPVMTLPQNTAYYFSPNYDAGRVINDAKAAATALGYNMNNYFQLVVFHQTYNTGFAGIAWGGYVYLNGYLDCRVAHHEYGHQFWLPHGNTWSTTDGNPISPGKTHVEYGDYNDPMGSLWDTNQYNTYNAYYKNICGWLPDSCVENISRTGTYRVYQEDGNTALNRTIALKVGRDYEFNYWISICGEAVPNSNFNNGVCVRAVSGYKFSDSHLLDINNPGDGTRTNAPLASGQTWYDADADVTIRTVVVGGTNPNRYADVEITYGSRSTGGHRPLVSGGVYTFRNRYNNKALEVAGNSTTNALPLTVWDVNYSDAQQWVCRRNADGTYSFNHKGTNLWMNVYNNNLNEAADIVQHTGDGSDAEKWYVSQNAAGYIWFSHKGTNGLILDMATGSGNDISQRGFSEDPWKQWYPDLVGMTPGTYSITPRHAQGLVLDIWNANTNDGNPAKIGGRNSGGNQKFIISAEANGRIRLTPSNATAKALDISSSSNVNGTAIQQWTWNNSAAQLWTYSRADGNWLRLTPDCAPASCMDAVGAGTTSGTSALLWQWAGAVNQQWRFVDTDL